MAATPRIERDHFNVCCELLALSTRKKVVSNCEKTHEKAGVAAAWIAALMKPSTRVHRFDQVRVGQMVLSICESGATYTARSDAPLPARLRLKGRSIEFEALEYAKEVGLGSIDPAFSSS